MFSGTAQAYPSEQPFRVGSWTYSQTLDLAEKRKTNIRANYKHYGRKKSFMTLAPGAIVVKLFLVRN
jgi:hypothetical protein